MHRAGIRPSDLAPGAKLKISGDGRVTPLFFGIARPRGFYWLRGLRGHCRRSPAGSIAYQVHSTTVAALFRCVPAFLAAAEHHAHEWVAAIHAARGAGRRVSP